LKRSISVALWASAGAFLGAALAAPLGFLGQAFAAGLLSSIAALVAAESEAP
jgi:hypothetical protein